MLANFFLVNRGFRKLGSRFNSCYYFSPLLNTHPNFFTSLSAFLACFFFLARFIPHKPPTIWGWTFQYVMWEGSGTKLVLEFKWTIDYLINFCRLLFYSSRLQITFSPAFLCWRWCSSSLLLDSFVISKTGKSWVAPTLVDISAFD